MRKILLGALLVANVSMMSAGIIFTGEGPGVTTTTVANTTTLNFNALSTGAFSGATAIGTVSAGGTIVAPDLYSGDATKYISVGAQSNTTSYTLTFNGAQTFFGLLWNAGDAQNVLTFFNGATQVGSFNVASFAGGLGAAYFGNPSATFKGQDGNEPFVYLDFTSNAAATDFTSVVFSNNNKTTGFETDNYAVLTGVPEPSTYGMLLTGLTALGLFARRRSI